jgi:non-specific serine/threonine protein kinase
MVAPVSSPLLGSLRILRTRLIGREVERATARALLLGDAVPLLTLTGPGGVGKTHLALTIAGDMANHFADGVIFVDLAPLADPGLVVTTVAAMLGVTPGSDQSVGEDLIAQLRPKQCLLLLLDNCEHLLGAVGDLVSALLAGCPALQVLTTSRAPLHLHVEQTLPVAPLPLPGDGASLSVVEQNEAVQLFCERTRAVRPSFILTEANAATVAALCRQLDGLPLAIELAAARSTVLSPEALLAQMSHRLQLLTHGARDLPARQRTIAATFAWSHDLLDGRAQALFRRLAVFVGGFTLEADQVVTASSADTSEFLTTLEALVAQGLVRRLDGETAPRFTLLETIRAFGLERLIAHGEEFATRDLHATYYLTTAEAVKANRDLGHELAWFECERPNIRAAMEHLEHAASPERLLELASAISDAWMHHGGAPEMRRWLEHGLAPSKDIAPRIRANALASLAGVLYQLHGEAATGLARGEEALALCQEDDWQTRARAATWCGLSAFRLGQAQRGKAFFRQAQDAERQGRPFPHSRELSRLDNLCALASLSQGQITQAEQLFVVARDRERGQESELGLYSFLAYSLVGLGHVARCRGNGVEALNNYQEGLATAVPVRDVRATALSLAGVAGALAALGHWRDAATLFGSTEALCHRSGLSFTEFALEWQRAAGLPEPWQRSTEPLGWLARLRERVQSAAVADPPSIPDAIEADARWTAGREFGINEAVALALAVTPEGTPTSPAAPDRNDIQPLPRLDSQLTYREHDVLSLLCERQTDAEIAERLFISPRTASQHVGNILGKLGARNRREAAALAVRLGLV